MRQRQNWKSARRCGVLQPKCQPQIFGDLSLTPANSQDPPESPKVARYCCAKEIVTASSGVARSPEWLPAWLSERGSSDAAALPAVCTLLTCVDLSASEYSKACEKLQGCKHSKVAFEGL
jgi:hypothetical protein